MFSSIINTITNNNVANGLKYVGLYASTGSKELHYENKEANPNAIAIYCIHGTCDKVSAFHYIFDYLQKNITNDIGAITVVSFKDRWKGISIKRFAEQLRNQILSSPYRNIILIGHSRGGLVATYFAEHYAKRLSMNVGVVTLSTPFQGTKLAFRPVTWISDSVQEMAIDSEFLKELHEMLDTTTFPYINYAAEYDILVDPKSSDIKNVKAKVLKEDHLSIMFSNELMDELKKSIEELVTILNTKKQNAVNLTLCA